MEEKHRQAAIKLIEWLQDHPGTDTLEAVAEVARRLRSVEEVATRAEAQRWSTRPMTAGTHSWDLWEMT